jgi:anaerobic magnesium-protoporphyrin IX monomethyl ester cyclase
MKINTDNSLKDKKVLLITLDSPFLDDQFVFPYLGILYLIGVADKLGADVLFTDHFDIESAGDFDVIGISCMTPQGQQAYELRRELKARYPGIVVMIGGPHATFYRDECRKEGFDIIVSGDGERVFEKLLTGGYESYLLPESTPDQLVFHDYLTEEEMNSYPIPYRSAKYIDRYSYDLNGVRATTLVNSRGCPMRCAFCESGGIKPKWFSPEHFEAEIKSIYDLGIKGVMIFDDLFALSVKKVKPYLEILKRYSTTFRCFGHARTMTPKLAGLLADSGCVEMGFGAESASQKILDTVNKRTTVGQMHDFVETVIGAGMKVKAFFIIGLPGETEKTAKETCDFIRKYRAKYPESFNFDLTVFFPYKGTQIGDAVRNGGGFDIRARQGLSWPEIDSNGYGAYKKAGGAADIVIETDGLTAERIKELQEETLSLR